MPTNIIPQLNPRNSTMYGITYTWNTDKTEVAISGTATANSYNMIWNTAITGTPIEVGRTYHINYSSTNVFLIGYFYRDSSNTDEISRFTTKTDVDFTVPAGTVNMRLTLWIANRTTVSETISISMYDTTYTDVDADIDMMLSLVGYPNSWFYPKWIQFASGALWDGESCSEIACCVSYMAGNLSKIYVSNYAQGLIDLFRANGRYGTTPSRGAFIWFDYDGDGIGDHTGRVYNVDNGIVYTFEGNVGGLTVLRQYYINDVTILGYGYPNYDNDPTTEPGDPTPPKFTFVPYFRHKRRERSN